MANLTSTLVILAVFGAITCAKLRAANAVSFNFSSFDVNGDRIWFSGDAFVSENAIHMTKNGLDENLKNSVGRAMYYKPIPIWERYSGVLADFSTEFEFIINAVNKTGSPYNNADGLAFFMAPVDSVIPHNSTGGWLGLFNDESNGNFKNQIVAVEFDTYQNEWDLAPFDHVGININDISSLAFGAFGQTDLTESAMRARITYDSQSKLLQVFAWKSYLGPERYPIVSLGIDLSAYLPQSVLVGFSAATGVVASTHKIISWNFTSTIVSRFIGPAPPPSTISLPIPSPSDIPVSSPSGI